METTGSQPNLSSSRTSAEAPQSASRSASGGPSGFLVGAQPGTRVVVRYRIARAAADGGDGQHSLTDAVGTIVSLDADSVTVETKRGQVSIPRDAVVACKEVPPAPRRRTRPANGPTPLSG